MEGSKKTRSVKKGLPCDMCGDVGYPEHLATCCICHRSREHLYCMRNIFENPEEWFCEACPSRKQSDVKEQALKGHQSSCSRGPSKIPMENDAQISNKNQRTGKVKFLSAEDVVMLTSGTKTKASTIRRRLDSQTSSAKTLHCPISKRTPVSVAEASKRFSQKLPTHGSSGPSKPSVLGSGQPHSILQPQVHKTTPQLHDKKSPLHSPYKFPISESLRTKETEVIPDLPLERARKILSLTNMRNADAEFVAKAKPKEPQLLRMDKPTGKEVHTSPNKEFACMEEPVSGLQDASSPPGQSKILSRFERLPDNFAINAIWEGSFEITNKLYEGLEAHPPGKVHCKAYEVSKQMPRMMKFDLHPRHDFWPEIFHIAGPSEDDIALYFLPGDFERSNDNYMCLLDLIEMEDLTMRSSLNDVELLIFASKQLPVDSQRINMKFYLWGVFRPVIKQVSSKPLTRNQHEELLSVCYHRKVGDSLNIVNEDDAKEVDMEIDMVGGTDVGKIDKPIKRPNSEENKVSFKLETPKRKYVGLSALDRHKNSDQSAPRPLSIVKIEQPLAFEAPPGFSKPVTVDAAHKGPIENQLARIPDVAHNLASPPGFPKPLKMRERVDSSAANKGLMERPLARIPADAHNLASPPGFPKHLKMKDRDDSSGTGNKKEKAAVVDVNPIHPSKKQNGSLSDPSKRDFRGSSLQPQKSTDVLRSPELPLKCQQVAIQGPPMNSMATDRSPLPESGRNGFDSIQKDVIQYNAKDGLRGSPPKSFPVWGHSRRKRMENESLGITELEKKEPSSKRRNKTVAECLELFPKVETEDQQFKTDNKLNIGAENKCIEYKYSPTLSLSRPVYMKDGERQIDGISKERFELDDCGGDVKPMLRFD